KPTIRVSVFESTTPVGQPLESISITLEPTRSNGMSIAIVVFNSYRPGATMMVGWPPADRARATARNGVVRLGSGAVTAWRGVDIDMNEQTGILLQRRRGVKSRDQ